MVDQVKDKYDELLACIRNTAEETRLSVSETTKGHIEEGNKQILHLLEKQGDKVRKLEDRCTKIESQHIKFERWFRRNNLLIFGLEIKKDENLLSFAIDFFKDKLGVGILNTEINNIYLLKQSQSLKVAPIKIEFVTVVKKDLVLKNCFKLKGTRIFIAQDLCLEDRQDLKVLQEHLKLAREKSCNAKIIRGNRLIIDNEIYTADQLRKMSGNSYKLDVTPEFEQAVRRSRSAPTTPTRERVFQYNREGLVNAEGEVDDSADKLKISEAEKRKRDTNTDLDKSFVEIPKKPKVPVLSKNLRSATKK